MYLLNKHISKNSSGNNEQDRKAQSDVTTAPKEFKYRYNNAKQLINLVNTMITIYDTVHEVTVMRWEIGQKITSI